MAKGTKHFETIKKEFAREALRQIILREMEQMVRAQVASAIGINHFFLRDKQGKFERITNPDEIQTALNADNASEGSTYWIFTKDPSTQAFSDLMNRALGKPAEEITLKGDANAPIVLRWQGDPE